MHRDLWRMAKFAAVAVAGLAVDLSVAGSLVALFGVPIGPAVVTGFLAGLAVNYILSEFFVFGKGRQTVSVGRFFTMMLAAMAVLATRVAVAVFAQEILGPVGLGPASIPIAVGVSFLVNYTLTRLLLSPKGA